MMKTKFYLTLFAINGLILSAGSLSAATISNAESTNKISELSRDIARLVDMKDRSELVKLAIERALLAQKVNVPQIPRMVTAGVPRLPTQDDRKTADPHDRQTQHNDKPKSSNSDRKIEPQVELQEIGRIVKTKPSTTDRASEPQIKIPPIGRIERTPSATP
jgi:hypothetical protein